MQNVRSDAIEDFAGCLKRLRKSRSIPLKVLAHRAAMDQSYVSGLEAGRRPPPRDKQLLRLGDAFHCSPEEISELFYARAISKASALCKQLCPDQPEILVQLICVVARLPADELAILLKIASSFALSSSPLLSFDGG